MAIFSKGYLTNDQLFLFLYLAKDTDIIDEAIYYFKANVFFKNYEIKVRRMTVQQAGCAGAWKIHLHALTCIHSFVLREE